MRSAVHMIGAHINEPFPWLYLIISSTSAISKWTLLRTKWYRRPWVPKAEASTEPTRVHWPCWPWPLWWGRYHVTWWSPCPRRWRGTLGSGTRGATLTLPLVAKRLVTRPDMGRLLSTVGTRPIIRPTRRSFANSLPAIAREYDGSESDHPRHNTL